MKLGDRIQDFAVELTKVGSIVGSSDELNATRMVMERFEEMDYFRKNPENLFYVNATSDPLERNSVVAVLKGEKGSSKRTVILIGHTDTVGTSDYGEIEAYAIDPNSLPEKLAGVTIPDRKSVV